MEEQNKRKTLILTIIAVLTLLILIGGATFAYFQAQVGKGESTTLNVKAGTTDDLSFSLKDLDATKENVSDNDSTVPIVIEPNQSNFASGKDSIADGVTGTATLIANDENYSSSKTYNVYLNITKNELKYSSYIKKVPDETPENVLSFKDGKTKGEADLSNYNPRPELYLTIKKNGEEIKTGVTINDNALSYVSNVFTQDDTKLGGFDITETKGLIKISVLTEIKIENGNAENHTTTDTWEITVTFMNLDTDQNLNTGKSVVGEVLIQSEEYVSQDIKTLNKLLADANIEETTLYYHDENLTGGAQDYSYRYSGGGYKITDDYKDKYSQINDVLIKQSCNGQDVNLDDYDSQEEYCYDEDDNDISKYYLAYKGKDTLYDTYEEAFQQAIKDNYIEKKVIKNFVCLDGKATTTGACESDNDLYRIIGLFKNNDDKYEMKLIKYDYATSTQLGETGAYRGLYSVIHIDDILGDDVSDYKGNKDNLTSIGGYYWTDGDTMVNEWVESELRKTNLNEYYLNTYLKESKHIDVDNLITNHIWSLNGFDGNYVTPKEMYDNEMDKVESKTDEPIKNKTIENKIGLMYASDYGYAASPSITNNWTKVIDYYDDIRNNNWIYMGLTEWTISRYSYLGYNVFYVRHSGSVEEYPYGSADSNANGVRPSFYLTSDVKIKSGDGTSENPYRLEI